MNGSVSKGTDISQKESCLVVEEEKGWGGVKEECSCRELWQESGWFRMEWF